MADWFKKSEGRYINLDWVVNVRVEGTPYLVIHDGRSITLNDDEAARLRRHLDAAAKPDRIIIGGEEEATDGQE